jgi:hypothetical protein
VFVTAIVADTRKLRVVQLSRIVALYVAPRFRLVRLTDPGRIAEGVVASADGAGSTPEGTVRVGAPGAVALAADRGAAADVAPPTDASAMSSAGLPGAGGWVPWDPSAIAVEARRRAARAARRTGVRVMAEAYDRLGDRSTGR